MAETARLLAAGSLGRLVAVSGIWCVRKPDDYFLPAWRRAPGGGPVLINLIHEIDLLRCLAGEIVAVGGCTSNAVRGFATEDSAALTLNFAGGAVGAMVLSDAAVSPWSWEQASGENPVRFFENEQNPYRFLGTEAALEFPRLTPVAPRRSGELVAADCGVCRRRAAGPTCSGSRSPTSRG